jgi:cell division protein FtsI/penicillin-binding protein 2
MTPRVRLAAVGTVAAWGLLAIRLIDLQGVRGASFAARAAAQQTYRETLPARPGELVDRHGRLLATTCRVLSLYVNPSQISEPRPLAERLATVLPVDANELESRIHAAAGRQFLWVRRHLTDAEAAAVRDLELQATVWGFREEYQRVYPQGTLAAHLVGWRDRDGRAQAGLEKSLERLLDGKAGNRTLLRDARGFVIDVYSEVTQPPGHGPTIRLTLDLEIQARAEAVLEEVMVSWQPRSASAIVLDPTNGELLAMAARPTFDPARPGLADPQAWTNPALSLAFEPGSTLKPLIVAWAVDRQKLSPEETFECGRGSYRMGHRTLHDHHPNGRLDVSGILSKSSNIGMAQIGQRFTHAELWDVLHRFGFGRRTGIELPSESAGHLRSWDTWDEYSTGSVPMGQEFSATPLQMIVAHAALANGGTLVTPHLILDCERADGRVPCVMSTRILQQSVADWVRTGPLVEAVQQGTARRAALAGVDVFAKTGTAQKYDVAAGAYAPAKYVASCVCGAPADQPQVIVLVTVDEPRGADDPYGGTVAAPACRDILAGALRCLTGGQASSDPVLKLTERLPETSAR